MFVIAWTITVVGWFVEFFEWRSFRIGRANSGSHGFLIAATIAALHTPKLPYDVPGRLVSPDTFLFPVNPPYASSPMNPWRLRWYGRGHVDPDGVHIEARIPVGMTMFVLGWILMAVVMSLMLFTVSAYLVAIVATAVTMTAAVGYSFTLKGEQAAATGIRKRT